jgi:hypothetical protein
MSILDLLVSPGVLIGTVIGVFAAVALGKMFPAHDLTFIQLLIAVGGFVVGLVLDVGVGRRHNKDR